MTLQDIFEKQADHCEDLGSPFTAGLCRLLGAQLDEETAVGQLIHNWSGSASHHADAVPLRLCGGLHALVLSGKSQKLADQYPPHSMETPTYSLIEEVFVEHEAHLLEWMKSPPQTNEVRRANAIWPGMCTVQNMFGLPLSILEIGASGGLNLNMDRFCYRLGEQSLGDADSSLVLKPQWRGAPAPSENAVINERAGCDINPLDPLNEENALRLKSYIWAGQQDRLERHDHAVSILRKNPVSVAKCDAVSFIRKKLTQRPSHHTTVVYSTIAWQYLSEADKSEGERLLKEAGSGADASCPLVWLRFEGDGQSPGGAITLKAWPSGETIVLGRADFHGRWVDWFGI